jgi:hypothetical protein
MRDPIVEETRKLREEYGESVRRVGVREVTDGCHDQPPQELMEA